MYFSSSLRNNHRGDFIDDLQQRRNIMLQHLKTIGIWGALLSCLFLIACASTPPIQEFADTANPSREIENLERNLEKARYEQVDVLSPNNYKQAEKSLKKSKEARDDNDSNKDILHDVAVGNAWLNQAFDTARQGSNAVPDIIDVRARALEAKASVHASKALKEADSYLREVGEDFEDGDFRISNKDRDRLLQRYMDIELTSIKGERLGKSVANIQQAEKEGAKRVAPQTLALAQKRLKDADAFITANRHDTAGIAKASDQAFQESERVLRITRESKIARNKSPEQIALDMEREQQAQGQLEQELQSTQGVLGATQSALATVAAETSSLSSQVALDEKLKEAKAQFEPDEAEVLRDGDKLLIRLKGLNFPSGQADIVSGSYPLMTKVQTVIQSFGDTEVEVEGHTDSIGTRDVNARLSEARAESVKNYLVQNGAVDSGHISSAGYADQKPISTNKTKQGRAQNRRVDIIITPM